MSDESIERKTLGFAERTVANLEAAIARTEDNANTILVQQTKQAKESLEMWRHILKALGGSAAAPAKQAGSGGA